MQRLAVLLILILLALSPLAVLADATIVVNTTADEDNTGSSCSLREAITSANNNANYGGCIKTGTYGNDTITFSPSVFNTNQEIALTSSLPDITSRITITGPGSTLLTVNGADLFRTFYISNSAVVTLSGMTTLNASTIDSSGGAIYLNSGTVTVNNMAFTSSIASLNGGAIYVSSGATATVSSSSFQENSATIGGAIYSEGTLRVSNSRFANNHSNDFGGAITNIGVNSVVGGSVFSANSSGISGGAYVGIGTIFNSTFHNNYTQDVGGAIYNAAAGSLKLIHVTVGSNIADNGGSGVYMLNGTLSMMNSILADNETDCVITGIASATINNSLIENGGCGITNGVSGNRVSDGFLDPNGLQNNGGLTQTLALSPASPAANAGNNSYRSETTVQVDFNGDGDKSDMLSTDQRGTGFNRLLNTTVDMGAFESSTVFTGLTVDTNSDALLYSCTAAANDCSLRGAMLLANGRTGTDTISFNTTVFASPQTITLLEFEPTVVVTESLNINGPGQNLLTIDGGLMNRFLMINNGASVSLSGIKVQNASVAGENGGAIYISNGNLSLNNTIFSGNNSSQNGGAIALESGSLIITSSSFDNSISGSHGGAIFVSLNGSLRISNSSFTNNVANGYGGAIYSEVASTIGGSSFKNNSAAFGGAVITYGGGIFNSSFEGNTASIEGGAVNNGYGGNNLSLLNVTISGSAAGSIGAGVYAGDNAVFIFNSIIAYSTISGDCGTNLGVVTVFNSMIEDGSCITNGVNGNIAGEPLLDPDGLQNNGGLSQTIELAPSSPAVNAGSNTWLIEGNVIIDFNGDGDFTDTLTLDQRGTGFNRSLNGTVDMGAFETSAAFTGMVVDTTSDTNLINCTSAANDCSLRGAINVANSRAGTDTISFDSTVFATSQTIINTGFPNITTNMNINGPGSNLLTIEGQFSYRPFYIENNAVVSISALRVRQTASGLEAGAAIYLDSGTLTLSNTIFSNNEASSGQGGVIYANTGSLTISDSSFTQNLASDSGGVIATDTATLTISESSFSQNTAYNSGGAIYNNSAAVIITDSSFDGNYANNNGGAIHNNNGGLVVTDGSFDQNSAGTNGGAIYTIPAIHILGSIFTDNSASGGGGAIIAVSDYATIVGSSFSENSASSGGALYGWMKIVNSSFVYNTATSQGGAIFAYDGDIHLFSTSIGFNSAGNGGGLYVENGDIQLVNTIVADSTSGGDCARVTGSFLAIASIVEDGGCGIVDGVNGNLVDDPMFDVRGLQDNGGTILTLTLSPQSPAINAGDTGPSSPDPNMFFQESGMNVDINADGDFNDSLDYDQRGASFPRMVSGGDPDIGAVEQTAAVLLEVDTTSDANILICTSAAGDCSLRGAINLANQIAGADTITFNTTVFATLQTINLTTALPIVSESLTITGSGRNLLVISGSPASTFYISNSANVTISNLSILSGHSDDNGGAIYLDSGTLSLNNIEFTNNTADNGAALFISTGTSARISNSYMSNNTSLNHGGAIYNQGSLRVDNSTFASNSAGWDGGAIYNENLSEDVVIGGSSFMFNSATDGGAIYGSTTSFNSTFSWNTASNLGGALFLNEGLHSLTLANVSIAWNTGAVNGGGIYVAEGAIMLANTIVSNNQGGDCHVDLGTSTVEYSLIEDAGCGVTNGVNGNLTGESFLYGGPINNGGPTYTLALPPASPAKDAGDLSYLSESTLSIDYNGDGDTGDILAFDQRGTGFVRLLDSSVDMGAYETSGTFDGLVVDIPGSDIIPFCTSAPNDCSLDGAIYLANGLAGADTITFNSVFSTPQTIVLPLTLTTITGDLTITGPGVNILSVEKEDAAGVFTIDNGAIVTISNMSLIGDDTNPGSLIVVSTGNLTVSNMSFSNNLSYSGGGINAGYGTTLTVNNSSFFGNIVTGDGGAINGATGSSMTVSNSSFSDNSAGTVGGAIFSDSLVHVSGSSFVDNSAANHGGAIYSNVNSTIHVRNSSFSGNSADAGGAISFTGTMITTSTISNSSFSGNNANVSGGAIYNASRLSIVHVSIGFNVSPSAAGLRHSGVSLNLLNSIISTNINGEDCVDTGSGVTVANSLIEEGGCGITTGVAGNLTGDAYFAPFANYGGTSSVLALLPFSPAINAGNNANFSEAATGIDYNFDGDTLDAIDTDQRGTGFNRLINTTVDMGAFEANPSTSVANVAPIRNYYSTNTPTLSWSRVSWATGYEIQISSSTNFDSLLCSGTVTVASSNLSHTTCALASGTYYWRVRALSPTGAGAWSTVDVFVVGGP